ncbi:putative DNA modification/repair radical SAM protein [Caldicellulosiruptor bescii]|uniref:Radical SAM domain protein n=2 Tax=Caldicellulosiruptor bescii TaxID=31899 RepID=B9ML06_CALBD|nr:putative DNA modification/repair radical SAM protein [Caldicellulosiruptor bescii]ACM61014.1 Radical SAM domain protein [Caldicellulosiruptor bescii DSM 6725]PBC89172.1 putative DNA modification/repair radical SAM protein [Caldicellulosiruptor bescii]PBC91346.1 putative DNA modification/repair radical SAM protein [Caldicellulosiruptor bescii]PBD03242.1 putative DNA modification/repair radical SAM protein [Caldicellulosiruptor bescii]PBD07144.1 putative DNA modification/repair radical SAM pr
MDILEKLEVLGAAAKYDVSCASSGSKREKHFGIGSTFSAGICHSWTDDGRCISLLKVLFTNECIFDCAYCINRRSNDIKRATFTPQEIAELTINFYKRNYIEGLFLSSAIKNSPDWTMEMLFRTVWLLRYKYQFNGYIHVKAIPYASLDLIKKTGFLVDRMSVNIELPSEKSLRLLCPNKTKESILKPMEFITKVAEEEKNFVSAGQSTQMIIGATDDSDYKIINLSQHLYKKFKLKRVYYSAYTPVNHDPRILKVDSPPLLREHRLYQADWLIRVYNFSADELFKSKDENLDLEVDPKVMWALRNLDKFPIEINKASYEQLIRVPGIGIKSAKRIIKNRVFHSLDFEDLKKMGVVLKRAKYFITCNGKAFERFLIDLPPEKIRQKLTDKNSLQKPQQLSFFDREVFTSVITGEI